MIGAKEPPQPRVRILNIPRVFSQQAMQDPTAIEVMVRDEMKKRLERHHERNQERKLTKEQRREKKKAKMFENTDLYAHVAVYKILFPLSGLNRFKIDVNAQQNFLKGCCIMVAPVLAKPSEPEVKADDPNDPQKTQRTTQAKEPEKDQGEIEPGLKWSVVVVEGGPKALRRYKKLMLRRIKWNDTENKPATATSESSNVAENEKGTEKEGRGDEADADNGKGPYCYLVWEGEVLQGSFHDFQMKNMKNEIQARKFLMDRGCVHYWDMAKNFIPSEQRLKI